MGLTIHVSIDNEFNFINNCMKSIIVFKQLFPYIFCLIECAYGEEIDTTEHSILGRNMGLFIKWSEKYCHIKVKNIATLTTYYYCS